MRWVRSAVTRIGIVSEFWSFMKVRMKWWMGPIVVLLLLLGFLIVLTPGSALAPSFTPSSNEGSAVRPVPGLDGLRPRSGPGADRGTSSTSWWWGSWRPSSSRAENPLYDDLIAATT